MLLPLLVIGHAIQIAASLTCKATSKSQPNPIRSQHPNDTTGTINGTIAVLPIPLSLARNIVPKQYTILEEAYRELLPTFPTSMYPALLETELDHDVGMSGVNIPDFSRASIGFPFVDRLGDGYTSMKYGKHILISADNAVAIAGTATYGYTVTPGTFDPPCDGYAAVGNAASGQTYFNASNALDETAPAIATEFKPLASEDSSPYTMHFWKNVTNQPQFSENLAVCDNYIRLFNSTVTRAPYKPTNVKGQVHAVKPYFPQTKTFKGVYGLRLDNAFIEHNYMTCQSLQGYHGTGSGD